MNPVNESLNWAVPMLFANFIALLANLLIVFVLYFICTAGNALIRRLVHRLMNQPITEPFVNEGILFIHLLFWFFLLIGGFVYLVAGGHVDYFTLAVVIAHPPYIIGLYWFCNRQRQKQV